MLGRSSKRLELTVIQFDAHALIHESNGHEQSRLLVAADDDALISREGSILYSNGLARHQAFFDRQGRPKINEATNLSQVQQERLDIGDFSCFLNASSANGVVTFSTDSNGQCLRRLDD